MLIQGPCKSSRPLGDEATLRRCLASGQLAQLQRRLEADAKAIFALYQYGKLHEGVLLRWGYLDELLPAPWHHHDEPTLHSLMREAHELGMGLTAVVGAAPGWDDPWSGACRIDVVPGMREYQLLLCDEDGVLIDDRDIQLARLEAAVH